MTNHHSDLRGTIIGGVLSFIYNIEFAFVGDTFKALILGAVGALGGFLANRILKKYFK